MVWNYVQELSGLSLTTTVCTALVIIIGILYILKNRDIPPGPTGLPFVGYWPFLRREDTHLQLQELMKKYGDVYSVNVAGQLLVHLGSIKAVKEANITKADCFAERSSLYSVVYVIFGSGILASNGEKWRSLRKFFAQAFKEYGIAAVKGYMSGPIYDSVNASIETLKAKSGSPVDIISLLTDSSGEIFRRMMFNDDQIEEHELKDVLENHQNVMSLFNGKNILLMGDIARYFILPTLKEYKVAVENHQQMVDRLTTLVRRHEQSYSEDNIRDLVDSYIRARDERLKKGDPSAEHFSESTLAHSLSQIAGDGVLGLAVFVAYFIHILLEYPEEEDKIYTELVDVVGTDRQVTLEDRNRLPYTNAFMQEVMRTNNFATLFPSLTCTKETTLNGYRIPKGAVTVYNLWACHRDPDIFEDPDEFKPSRYLSVQGKPKSEAPITFGIGKRSCAGEAFSMSQLFIFLTSLVQNFHFQRPESNKKKHFLDEEVMEICAHVRK